MNTSLRFSGVRALFESRLGSVAALESFSLQCAASTVTCLVGPNGAGKSTVLALAAGLIRPSAGEITCGNRVVSLAAPPPGLGYLPQQSAFPVVLTVADVVDFAAAARGTDADGLRQVLALSGLEAVMQQTIGTLSSGWVRRLGLAVALMPPVDLIVLDEPFVGLDLEILDRTVAHLAQRVEDGAAVLLSSHDFAVIDQLDARVAVIDQGSLLGVQDAGSCGSRALYRRLLAERARRERTQLHAVGE
jgi:ABC-2 type transport system ATP-binding protein